ncbi:MAG: hypothetical protein ABIM30_00495 [candidate division WOR-3 bacterium]
MATRIRTYNQLDDVACNSITSTYLSHNNCLISEPTLYTDFSEGKLKLLWSSFNAIITGMVYSVPAGQMYIDDGDLPPTTVFIYFKPEQNPYAISYTYDDLPTGDYALIGTIRYKTRNGVFVYYVNPENNSIHSSIAKLETRLLFERPKYLGGIRPITITDDGYLSTSSGLILYGKELIAIPDITNGKFILDNETIIDKLTDITTYLDDTTVPDGMFIGVNVAINVTGVEYGVPYLVTRMRSVPYYTMEECLYDKYGAIQTGFPIKWYFNAYMPLAIFVFRKGFFKERCLINLLDSYFINKIINSERKKFDDFAISTIADDDFDNIQPQLRYDLLTNKSLTIGQTKSCVEITLNGVDAYDYGGITPSTEANGNYDMSTFVCHFKLENNVNSVPIVGWINPGNIYDHLFISVDNGKFRIMRNGSFILNRSDLSFNYGVNYFLKLEVDGGRLTSSVCPYSVRGDLTNVEVFNENDSITIGSGDYVPFVGVMNYSSCSEFPKFLCDFIFAKRLRHVV